MTTQQIASRLAELCRKAAFEAAQKELFANDVTSIEPYATPAFEKETKGLPAVIEKGRSLERWLKALMVLPYRNLWWREMLLLSFWIWMLP